MRLAVFLSASFLAALLFVQAYAATLTFISDLISTSAPEATSTHTIQFKLGDDVPASGHIVVTPQNFAFTIPASFDYTDVDLAVADSLDGPYADRSIADTADLTNDGVAVTSGMSGSVRITLNSTDGIVAGKYVQIQLGANATFGATSTSNIQNPSGTGSYLINAETRDASNVIINSAQTMIAIVAPVGITAHMPVVEPTRFNGLPSGLVAANNTRIEISLETNIPSTCHYATTTNVLYDDMLGRFSSSIGLLFFTTTEGYTNNTAYTYYVRCRANGGGTNQDDYPITFTLKPDPISNTSIEREGFITSGPTGNLGNGGAGEFPNGSAVLYLSSVRFAGVSVPGSLITVLKDGVKAGSAQAKSDGTFTTSVTGLERGAYGFQLYAQDAHQRTSSMYGATLSVSQGTDNDISDILVPPTIALSADSVSTGDPLTVSGSAPPNTSVQVVFTGQSSTANPVGSQTYTATTSVSGDWTLSVDSGKFAKGEYLVQAQILRSNQSKSGPSKSLQLSVGKTGASDKSKGLRSDINRDGKVNLVDFSILLSFWQTADPDADINEDGIVNLADFSIMLFDWTG